MSIKAVIWDLGGVLVRTEDFTHRESLAKSLGMTRADLEELAFGLESGKRAQLGEYSIDQHWENVRRSLELTKQEMDSFKETFWAGDALDTDLIDYIRSLRVTYSTALLSNAFTNLRYMLNSVWKIADAFDDLIISAEVGLIKPDKRIYQLTVERLDVEPSDAVFIDDFQHNIDGAKAVGLFALRFQNPTQIRADLVRILNEGTGKNV